MHKAAQLKERLEQSDFDEGTDAIEAAGNAALCSLGVGEDAMCMMHNDGSVNIIEVRGHGVVTCETISAVNILKVLHHYRPFSDLFKDGIQ